MPFQNALPFPRPARPDSHRGANLRFRRLAAASVLGAAVAGHAAGLTADRVLIVRNSNSPISKAIAADYMQRRGVAKVVDVAVPDGAVKTDAETIAYADYLAKIETPLRAFLSAHAEIDAIVMTKGVPLRLDGAQHLPSSLDSYVAALDYAKLPGAIRILVDDPNYRAPDNGPFHGLSWSNRYWNSKKRFTHAEFGGYLVTRLDGYTQADAIGLTTKSLAAEAAMLAGKVPAGQILLDEDPGYGVSSTANQPYSVLKADPPVRDTSRIPRESDYADYNADMQLASDTLKARKLPYLLETSNTFKGHVSGLMGYVSWGSNDHHYDAAAYQSLGFMDGAIAETAVSTGARTFLPTSGGQSLVADIVHQGVTGMKGYCDEPFLQGTASPSIMYGRYTAGWTLAETFWAASNEIGWEDIVIGDPLARAYPSDSSATSALPGAAGPAFAAPVRVRQIGGRMVFTLSPREGGSRTLAGASFEGERFTVDILDLRGKRVAQVSAQDRGEAAWEAGAGTAGHGGAGLYLYRVSLASAGAVSAYAGRFTVAP